MAQSAEQYRLNTYMYIEIMNAIKKKSEYIDNQYYEKRLKNYNRTEIKDFVCKRLADFTSILEK